MSEQISIEDQKKIQDALDSIRAQYDMSSLNHTVMADNTKLIECRHEIIISVLAHVLEEDDTGQTVGSKEICKKNYHIPVPSHQDYQIYLMGFFNFLEKCMSSSIENQQNTTQEP